MLRLNEKLMYIKCSTYEYLVKKGSISNYSYNIIDEKKLGVLETLFHHETYPIHKEQLLNRLGKNMSGDQKNELESIIEEFLELDILVEEKEHLSQKAAILTKSHYTEIVNERFKEMGFSCCFILSRDEVNPSGTTPVENVLFVDDYNDESLEKLLSGFDIIIVIWDHFIFRYGFFLCKSVYKQNHLAGYQLLLYRKSSV